jgi:sigma-B regulation protein RsbU (phosphoserine phosphatase)
MQNPISLLQSRLAGRLPKGLAGASLWLAAWFCLLFALRLIPGRIGSFFSILQILVGLALIAVGIPALAQLVRRRMLWSLRNKLVLTYLLIGLAPAVLFFTLVSIMAYVAAGQFAIHLADSRLRGELSQMSSETKHRADLVTELIAQQANGTPQSYADAIGHIEQSGELVLPRVQMHQETQAFVNGASVTPPHSDRRRMPFGLPPWATELPEGEFSGLILDGRDLYLIAVHQKRWNSGQIFSLMSSVPVDRVLLKTISEGLGEASILPERTVKPAAPEKTRGSSAPESPGQSATSELTAAAKDDSKLDSALPRAWIVGGTEPPAVNLADLPVRFTSTEPITDWDSGRRDAVFFAVQSRPSLLYNQLFGASLSGIVTSVIRIALVLLCLIFALIELLALVMAIRLSRTITASVADLYQATLQIDRGELDHQIVVKRDDQLAELSKSFNKMTGSLKRLLVEQKEKERLQNELSIAQEVQANLFPHRTHNLDALELHGVCRPARSVSGDYYDFLVFHREARDGQPSRMETGVAIAIGDISGKGISAALLMATLHSAVRAYRFASEELVYSESSVAGLTASREERGGDHDELFESPGRILSLLNRHLYRSTQPEKYATLFLAHYDSASAMLTYSNAGQLPPLVLSLDGTITRLDKGGTVVGLMDGMHYEEGRVQMQSGDVLVCYSDGVTEPENDFGEFGEERLMDVVRRYRDQPLHTISSQVMQALDAWIGAEEQPDDITLVLARQV